MPRGGKRKGAGRKAGTPNAATKERREQTAIAIEESFRDGRSAEYHLALILLTAAKAGDLQAAIHLDNRLQGKPREALEVTGAGGGPLEQRIFRSRLASGAPALAKQPARSTDAPASG